MELQDTRRFRQPSKNLTLAIQFWTTMTSKDFAQPEKDLMRAVLTDAIWDYKKNLAARNALFREAREWLFGANGESLFSFESICDMLELSPSLIRRELLHLESQGI